MQGSVHSHVPQPHHPLCLCQPLALTAGQTLLGQGESISAPRVHSTTPILSQAVSHYVSSMSWTKLLINLLHPNLNDMMEEAKLKHLQQETFSLQSDADWVEALQKSLLRQRWGSPIKRRTLWLISFSHFNTIISELLKGVTRIIGWTVLGLVTIVWPRWILTLFSPGFVRSMIDGQVEVL